jgi:Tfp pilus assembly protein PilO
MSGKSGWKTTKNIVVSVLGVLLALDVGLGVFLWRTSRESPEEAREEVAQLALQAKLRQAEVVRGEKIRASLPQVGRDCDKFFQDTFVDKATGYSELESDLYSIANKAGLRISDTNYKEQEVKSHGVTEITISADVEGSYSSLIQFIDGLQQSKNFYLLNNLSLGSSQVQSGGIKLQLELRTYFRS